MLLPAPECKLVLLGRLVEGGTGAAVGGGWDPRLLEGSILQAEPQEHNMEKYRQAAIALLRDCRF